MCSVDFPCSSSLPSLSPFFFWVIAEPFFLCFPVLSSPKRLFFLMTMSSPLSFPGFCSRADRERIRTCEHRPGAAGAFSRPLLAFRCVCWPPNGKDVLPGAANEVPDPPSPASCLYREHLGRPEPDQARQRSQSTISTKVCPFKTFRTQRHKLPHFIK